MAAIARRVLPRRCARHVLLTHPFCPEAHLDSGELHTRSLAEANAYELQAVGRCSRFPQEREVCVYRLYVQGTVEEELLAAKVAESRVF